MINEFPTEFIDLRESPISEDMPDIEDKMEWFYLTINFDRREDIKNQCIDARNYLDSCRILVRNLLDKDENKYIKGYGKKFELMDDNLGRIEKRINKIESDNIEGLERDESYQDRDLSNSPKIRIYVNYLIKCMEHLVYYPLKKAWNSFRDKNLEGGDLFLYSVFIELYNSSQSLGGLTAEETRTLHKSSPHPTDNPDEIDDEDFTKPEEIQTQDEEKEEEEDIDEEKIKEREESEKNIFG